ncbi:glycine zipper 2TM domain-containing protein [Stakelama saccharophila]|uniref:17 kDa surface antigen n=1 Tax=Stakelama saccharophila TaxID=3075605 RepID=A0ABZ0BAF4_9SPHN|nr:glycine zipper 2TM domain-containing protein [Stakelama sp. W311]WNO54395.1 glycine zipper 2TM domain-containing protein [Stakelama sp. W311]
MRNLVSAITALSLAVPAAAILPASQAEAGPRKRHDHGRHHKYKEWKGRDGRYYCRKPDGTTGLVVGGVAGALLGRTIDTDGDRTVGTVAGAAAGALAGREIERGASRCK